MGDVAWQVWYDILKSLFGEILFEMNNDMKKPAIKYHERAFLCIKVALIRMKQVIYEKFVQLKEFGEHDLKERGLE